MAGCPCYPRFLSQLSMLADVSRRKGVSAGSLDVWSWRDMQALPVAWFDGLARILSKMEEVGVWPDGLLDVFFFLKVDGDATPLGERPFGPLLV